MINDGSADRTGEILKELESPALEVIDRLAPNARQGKAAALNYAFAQIFERLDPDPERIIVSVVDADGRISPEARPSWHTTSWIRRSAACSRWSAFTTGTIC